MTSNESVTTGNGHDAEPANDHPGFTKIWIVLLVLLGISVLCGLIHNVLVMNVLVFSVAGIKIFLVARYFMHLKDEPRLITIVLIGAFCCLVALYIGTIPDVGIKTGWSGR